MRNWKRKTTKTQLVGSIVASVPLQLTAFVLLGLSIGLIASPTLAEPLFNGQSNTIFAKETVTVTAKETDNVQPAQKQKPAQKSNGKKPHPVVIAPEPLSATSTATPASSTTVTTTAPRVTASVTPVTTKVNLDLPLKPIESATSTQAEKDAEDDMNLRGQVKRAKPRVSSVQHHSAAPVTTVVNPVPATHAKRQASTNEPGFYPVGFTPAARPVTAVQMSAMEKALSHYNRGVYYSQRQQWDNAIAEYNQVLLINQQPLADAYVGISTASIHKRDWENALKNANKALRFKAGFIDPGNITQARFNLSTIYCVADDYHEAKHFYKIIKKAGHPQAPALAAFLEKNCGPKP
jgi:hypothetical protein